MTRRRPAAEPGPPLPLDVKQPASRGRTARAVEAAIRAGQRAGQLDELDAGVAALARQLARACDAAESTAQPYALAQLGPRLLDALVALGLSPSARPGSAGDEWDRLAAELGAPTLLDGPQP